MVGFHETEISLFLMDGDVQYRKCMGFVGGVRGIQTHEEFLETLQKQSLNWKGERERSTNMSFAYCENDFPHKFIANLFSFDIDALCCFSLLLSPNIWLLSLPPLRSSRRLGADAGVKLPVAHSGNRSGGTKWIEKQRDAEKLQMYTGWRKTNAPLHGSGACFPTFGYSQIN